MSDEVIAQLFVWAALAGIGWYAVRRSRARSGGAAAPAAPRPQAVACDRIRKQLNELDAQLQRINGEQASVPHDDELRSKWRRECVSHELSRLPVDAERIPWLNDALIHSLWEAGLKDMAALGSIRHSVVDGIGPEREKRLFKLHKDFRDKVEENVARLADREVDVLVRGKLSDAVLEAQAKRQELDRARSLLEARRAMLLERAEMAGLVMQKARGAREAVESAVAASPGRCPSCGGELRRKRGRRGAFIGCSRFPACRYSRDALRRRLTSA